MPNGKPRPIAVASWPRRLVSRILATRFRQNAPSLAPLQWGLTRSGPETVHSALSTLLHSPHASSLTVTTIDFANAFGSLPRSWIHDALATLDPNISHDLYRYAYHFLLSDTTVTFTSHGADPLPLTCRTGVPQGDPLSPLLFCLAIQPRLQAMQSPTLRSVAYLDDLTFLSTYPSATVIATAIHFFYPLLELNVDKCKQLFTTSSHLGASFDHSAPSPSVTKASLRLNKMTECPSPQHILPLARFALNGTTYSSRLGDRTEPASESLRALLLYLSSTHNLNPGFTLTPGHVLLSSLPLARGGLGLPDPCITSPHLRSDCLQSTFSGASSIIHHLTHDMIVDASPIVTHL